MKSLIVFLLLLTVISSERVIQAQTPPRKPNNSAASNPRSETIRICQGLPTPDGYVIIAYLTSAACPHGAYVLKKQNDYESSLAVNSGARTADDSTGPTTANQRKLSSSTAQSKSAPTQSTKNAASPKRLSADPRTTSSAAADDVVRGSADSLFGD